MTMNIRNTKQSINHESITKKTKKFEAQRLVIVMSVILTCLFFISMTPLSSYSLLNNVYAPPGSDLDFFGDRISPDSDNQLKSLITPPLWLQLIEVENAVPIPDSQTDPDLATEPLEVWAYHPTN